MSKLNKVVKKYVRSYQTNSGLRWKFAVSDGRSGQIRESGFLTEMDAVQAAVKQFQKVLMNKNKSDSGMNSKMTFKEYSEVWLQKKLSEISSVTHRRYTDQVRDYLNPFFGTFKLIELEKFHLRNFISENQNSKEMSTYNMRSSVILFKMMIRQAIEDDYMEMSGILLVKTPKHQPAEPKFWDLTETTFFLNASADSKWINLWKFGLWTGMRAGELAGLKWDSILMDLERGGYCGYIRVCRTCEQKTRIVRETTKNGDIRMIPILPELRHLILEMKISSVGEFVFGGNQPLDPSHFSRLLNQDLKKVPQVPKIKFHSLRHTFCSYLDSTNMPRRTVAEVMGHRDLKTTNRYSHVSSQTLGNEFMRWNENRSQQNSSKILKMVN